MFDAEIDEKKDEEHSPQIKKVIEIRATNVEGFGNRSLMRVNIFISYKRFSTTTSLIYGCKSLLILISIVVSSIYFSSSFLFYLEMIVHRLCVCVLV